MRALSLLSILGVLLAANAEKTIFLSGKSECLDCAEKNIKNELAYQGLQVSIKCKTSSGDYETKGTSKLSHDGSYKIQLPAKLNGDASECIAQLHSVSNALCPHIKNEPNPSKLVWDFKKDPTPSKLPFSISTCTSAFLWPHKKYYFHPIYKKPYPHYIPIYKPPIPIYKPVPIYKPPVPIYIPVPIYKPPVSIYKPVPIYMPPVPIYKKPCPPMVPVPIPIYKKPTHPLLTFPPIYKKPYHHFPKYPPMYEKPLPPHTK